MEKSILIVGASSILLLGITLFFVGSITGAVVAPLQEGYLNLSFFFALFLGIAVVELFRYYKNNKNTEINIKKLIEDAKESSDW